MTQNIKLTPITFPWDMAAVHAAAFGLFTSGALMAARRQAAQTAQHPPQQGQ